jgi:GAF domain-containing protein
MFVACWYIVVFGLFGVFTFPFRLMRRSQRKSQHVQQVSLATQQAMFAQQQQQMYAQQQALWAQQQGQQRG